MRARICLSTLIALIGLCLGAAPADVGFIIGMWHRPLTDDGARAAMWDRCERAGVTDLFVEVFHHGFTIYPSNAERTFEERPDLAGRDLLGAYIEEGHARGIRVHAWLDLLLWGPDPERKPDAPLCQYESRHDLRVMDAEGRTTRMLFVSPAHPEVSHLVTLLPLEIGRLHPDLDGIHLDRVRYPGGADFTRNPAGITAFIRAGHRDPSEDDSEANLAAWREACEGHLRSLVSQIALVVHEIHSRTIDVTAAVRAEPGVDDFTYETWPTWLSGGSLDAVVPQCFAGDIETITQQARGAAEIAEPFPTPCLIGLAYRPGDDSPSVSDQLEAVEDLPIQGVVWFSENWLAEEPELFDEIGAWVRGETSSPEAD
ncbi:family 10 glycosylhydrolase [Candidatus Sumerlaeota bacterium]|nr:family 10 glycosylhydrolase [Candidatus Sumerlaeota bacterium]